MWLNAAVTFMKDRLAAFARSETAAVSVDFVVAIPILLAVLVFTSEYGRVLQMRSVLDNAVSDATRYLARAPNTNEVFPPEVIAVAEQIIRQRVNVNHIAIGAPDFGQADASATSQYQTVSLTVSIGVETPAIAVIALASYGSNDPKLSGTDESGTDYELAYRDIEGFVLTSSDTARYFGR